MEVSGSALLTANLGVAAIYNRIGHVQLYRMPNYYLGKICLVVTY